MRTKLIAANWKMYKTPSETSQFFEELLPLIKDVSRDLVVCPPTIDLPAAVAAASGSKIGIGAQNMHFAEEGAYTGETSPRMLTELGVTHVILGHSERRQYFGETDESIHHKLLVALKHRLTPIVCIGERLEDREGGRTEEVLNRQITLGIGKIPAAELEPLVIAYEPVWAIGTGRTATPELAAQAHAYIRGEMDALAGKPLADRLRILYGGSVKPGNAAALLRESEIDGALVGGASLAPDTFIAIAKA